MIKDRRYWLVTGGCGFIGTALIKRILEDRPGDRVRVLDNLAVGTKEDLWRIAHGAGSTLIEHPEYPQGPGSTPVRQVPTGPRGDGIFATLRQAGQGGKRGAEGKDKFDIRASEPRVELIVGDITAPAICVNCAKGMDVIVHLAANTGVGPSVEDPVFDMKSNVAGTVNMLEAARQNGVKRFVFASSGAPVGEVKPPIHENLAPRPVSPYGASKLAGEGYCSAYFRSFGVETVALRFGNVYGPGSSHKSSVVAKFIKHILAEETLPIYGDGSQTRDFIYIRDIVQAILLSVGQEDAGGEIFQIATHREHTVEEVAEALNRLANRHLGREGETVYEQARTGDVKRNYSDISKARRMLGFEPQWDLDQGLEETFLWFLKGM